MNGDKASIDETCSWLVARPLYPNTVVVVGVPGCYLQHLSDKLKGSQVVCFCSELLQGWEGRFYW